MLARVGRKEEGFGTEGTEDRNAASEKPVATNCNWSGEKRLEVADSKRGLRRGTPHPRCFVKRVCKLLKTKDRDRKKSAKRIKESANL
jgi:hypothetical protein